MSRFDGNTFQLIGYYFLSAIIIVFTFGIAAPWAICMMKDWEIKHTVIDGQRLYFDGNAVQLFGLWIKWLILIIVTLGLYSFFVYVDLKKWTVKHTHYA